MDVRSAFDELAGELDYPMFIVTVRAGSQLAGCLVGFGTQCSIDPPRFLAGISRVNRTYRVARHADLLAVHVVPREAEPLARLFGGRTGDEVDKFAQCSWAPGPQGVPILTECANWFAGRVLDRLDLGDHVGHLLDPVEVHHGGGRPSLEFQQAKRIEPGHPA